MFLLFIRSKIQFFESKSQQDKGGFENAVSCLSGQRYNFLKANHNGDEYCETNEGLFIRSKIQFFESKSQRCRQTPPEFAVVYPVKDTIFWKQITTIRLLTGQILLLFIRSKIQFFESKSQLCLSVLACVIRCLSGQRYNFLKANHNRCYSQRKFLHVVYPVKDTIFWKQITTADKVTDVKSGLFIRSKIQFFESKSQRVYLYMFNN